MLNSIISQGHIPVIAPVGAGEDVESLNVNADYVAGEIASALKADKFILLTNVEGIFADPEDENTLISSFKVDSVQEFIDSGKISKGMIPKVRCCIDALKSGVGQTHIIDGRKPHSLLLEIFTKKGIGTMVVE